MTAVYPSLSSGAGYLTLPSEVIPSIIRHMFSVPSVSSDHFDFRDDSYKLSFRRLESDYGTNPDGFCDRYKFELSRVLTKYFPTRSLSIQTYYKYIDESNNEEIDEDLISSKNPRYVVYLDIQDLTDGGTEPVFISSKLYIDHNKSEFKIVFDGKES